MIERDRKIRVNRDVVYLSMPLEQLPEFVSGYPTGCADS